MEFFESNIVIIHRVNLMERLKGRSSIRLFQALSSF